MTNFDQNDQFRLNISITITNLDPKWPLSEQNDPSRPKMTHFDPKWPYWVKHKLPGFDHFFVFLLKLRFDVLIFVDWVPALEVSSIGLFTQFRVYHSNCLPSGTLTQFPSWITLILKLTSLSIVKVHSCLMINSTSISVLPFTLTILSPAKSSFL